MSSKKSKRNTKKDLFLDRKTSHGGWPHGHQGSYKDPTTPVNKQIYEFLKSMGLIDDSNPRARLSEGFKISLSEDHIRRLVKSRLNEQHLKLLGDDEEDYEVTPVKVKTTNKTLKDFLPKRFSSALVLGPSGPVLTNTLKNAFIDLYNKILDTSLGNLTKQSANAINRLNQKKVVSKIASMTGISVGSTKLITKTGTGSWQPNTTFSSEFSKYLKSQYPGIQAGNPPPPEVIELFTQAAGTFSRETKSDNLPAYDLRTSEGDSSRLKEVFNEIPDLDDVTKLGSHGEYIVSQYAGFSYYLNLKNINSPDIKIAGKNPNQFPGADLWLNNSSKSFLSIEKKGDILDFTQGVFASVKTSQFSGTSSISTQPPALDKEGQVKAAVSIMGGWLLKNYPEYITEIKEKFEFPKNEFHPIFKVLCGLGIKRVKMKFDAYNFSGISPLQASEIFASEDAKAPYIAYISKKENPVEFVIDFDCDKERFSYTATKIDSSTYPENIAYLVGDDIKYNMSFKESDIPADIEDFKSQKVKGRVFDLLSSGRLSLGKGVIPSSFNEGDLLKLIPQASQSLSDVKFRLTNLLSQKSFKKYAESHNSILNKAFDEYALTSTQATAAYKLITDIIKTKGIIRYPHPDYEKLEKLRNKSKITVFLHLVGFSELGKEGKEMTQEDIEEYIDRLPQNNDWENADKESLINFYLDNMNEINNYLTLSKNIKQAVGDDVIYLMLEEIVSVLPSFKIFGFNQLFQTLKSEVKLALLIFRFFEPKPPGITGAQLSTLSNAMISENSKKSEDSLSKAIETIINRIKIIFKLVTAISNEVTPRSEDKRIAAESVIYKKLIHKKMLENFNKNFIILNERKNGRKKR